MSNKIGGEKGHMFSMRVWCPQRKGEKGSYVLYESTVFNKIGGEMGHMFSMRAW